MNNTFRVSVITVCWNCADEIENTVRSVLDQTYKNIEFIVIDGGSTDGTLEYLESLSKRIDVLVTESDKGLYDAMNKGVNRASGDYVIFMNAGDKFLSNKVVKDVIEDPEIIEGKPKIISGRVQFEYKGKLLNRFRPSKFGKGSAGLPHQATFIDKQLQEDNPFDIRLKWVADYELWQRLKFKGLFDVFYIPNVIAVFALGGRSNDVKYDTRRLAERLFVDSIYSDDFGVSKWIKAIVKIIFRRIVYRLFGSGLLYWSLYVSRARFFERNA